MNYFASHKIILAILTAAVVLMLYQMNSKAMEKQQLLFQPTATITLSPTASPTDISYPSTEPAQVKTPDEIRTQKAGSACTTNADCGGGGCNRCQAGYGCVNICNNEP